MSSTETEPVIAGLEWRSERIPYPEQAVTGDTYPMTWSDDDEIYTSAGDPMWGGAWDMGMDEKNSEKGTRSEAS